MTWDQFEIELVQKLKDKVSTAEEPGTPEIELIKIAEDITNLYHQVSISAMEGSIVTLKRPLAASGALLLSGAMAGIQAAIFASLLTMQKTNIKPNMALMSPIGAAVAAYWATTMVPLSFSPYPTPPLYVALSTPAPGVLVLFPGNPISVTNGFKKAFTRNYNTKSVDQAYADMAKDIRNGLEKHMQTISGIYVGLVPGIPPFPLPTPWTGLAPII